MFPPVCCCIFRLFYTRVSSSSFVLIVSEYFAIFFVVRTERITFCFCKGYIKLGFKKPSVIWVDWHATSVHPNSISFFFGLYCRLYSPGFPMLVILMVSVAKAISNTHFMKIIFNCCHRFNIIILFSSLTRYHWMPSRVSKPRNTTSATLDIVPGIFVRRKHGSKGKIKSSEKVMEICA